MKIAVFGSTPRAVAIGKLLVDTGYHVCFGDAVDLKSAEAAAEASAAAGTPYNDAAVCEMLIFANSRKHLDELLARAGCLTPQAVVVDAMEGEPAGDRATTPVEEVFRTAGCVTMYCGPLANAAEISIPGAARTGDAAFEPFRSPNGNAST